MDIEAVTIRKATIRLIPLLAVCYLIAYLDRKNVSFAALTMNADLNISATAYGLGASLFFLTYFVFEVPSNLIMEKVGARLRIARIMFTWGILSGMTAFIPEIADLTGFSSISVFYAIRLLLGIAEAGFFPGVIFYLTIWFPRESRAKIVGYFMAAIPVSSVMGAPISGALLGFDGVGGLYGWQWTFMLEAAPAIILTFVVLIYLADRPEKATWLDNAEQTWLTRKLDQERHEVVHSAGEKSWVAALVDPRVIALSLVHFGFAVCLYGLGFLLPQIIKGFGLSNLKTGFVTAIPYVVGAIAAVYWGKRSDRKKERRFHCVFGLVVAAIGITGSVFFDAPAIKVFFLAISAFGLFGGMPVFWSLPSTFLACTAAAAGIAVINSVGNLAGFVAPFGVGYLKDTTGSFDAGLLALAACGILAAAVVVSVVKDVVMPSSAVRGKAA